MPVVGLLNHLRVAGGAPDLLLCVVRGAGVHAGGLHATLAGVLLAIVNPTRPPPDYRALMAQADAILSNEATRSDEALRSGPSEPVMHALDEKIGRAHD